jgi:hypothetical protein
MAINRAPFNALVDDDGTGTTGTPWNKSAIQSVILDPVDAAIAAAAYLPQWGQWTDVPFNPANFWSDVSAAMVPINRYTVINKTLFWVVQVYNATVPNPLSPYLPFTFPAGLQAYGVVGPLARVFDTVETTGYYFLMSNTVLAAIKTDSTNWTTYPIHVYFSATIPLV